MIASLRKLLEAGGYNAFLEGRLEFDGIRADPEFQAVMGEINARLTDQRRRLRELEASGKLAPLPDLPAG